MRIRVSMPCSRLARGAYRRRSRGSWASREPRLPTAARAHFPAVAICRVLSSPRGAACRGVNYPMTAIEPSATGHVRAFRDLDGVGENVEHVAFRLPVSPAGLTQDPSGPFASAPRPSQRRPSQRGPPPGRSTWQATATPSPTSKAGATVTYFGSWTVDAVTVTATASTLVHTKRRDRRHVRVRVGRGVRSALSNWNRTARPVSRRSPTTTRDPSRTVARHAR
ncbi:hypothetical protein H4W33_001189 [Kibdelosporangium phytohabitans]|nr:hypothetical protein [Kibdelosporangium phytohabitans]